MQNGTVRSDLQLDVYDDSLEPVNAAPTRSHAAFLATLDALEAEFSEILNQPWAPTKE